MDLVAELGAAPVFPNRDGLWRDPSSVQRDFRDARGNEFEWVISHTMRKTAATMLDDAGLTARQIADQLGHSQVSITQNVYIGRKTVDGRAAKVLDAEIGKVFPMHNSCTDLEKVAE
jgi:integrase